jgi:hypothetical protein
MALLGFLERRKQTNLLYVIVMPQNLKFKGSTMDCKL